MLILAALAMLEAMGKITVTVNNVRNNRGQVYVEICPQNRFLKENCPYHATAPAHAGSTVVTIENVPAGQYAAQGYHDENKNNDLDQGLFGIPKEGLGFSRDARIGLGPPKWKDAVFVHTGPAEAIHFSLRYFMGAKGPAPRR